MSGTSGRTLPVPLGFFDPGTRSLRTSRTTFESASTLSSATLPTSGSMLSGTLYKRTRSALRTSAAGSSSSPQLPTPCARDWKGEGYKGQLPNSVALLKTPTAQLAVNGGSQHPDKRKAGGHGPTLADEVEHLLPTPTASSPATTANFRPDGTPYSEGYGMTLLDAARLLLPTPTASDGERSSDTYPRGNPTLSGAVSRRRSRGGKRSLAAPPHGQLTIDLG